MGIQAPDDVVIHVSSSQLNLLKRRHHPHTANDGFGFNHFHTSQIFISSGETPYQVTDYNGSRDCRAFVRSAGTCINCSVKSGHKALFHQESAACRLAPLIIHLYWTHKGADQCPLCWKTLALLVKVAAFSLWVFRYTQKKKIWFSLFKFLAGVYVIIF